jgi:hypothetical protein
MFREDRIVRNTLSRYPLIISAAAALLAACSGGITPSANAIAPTQTVLMDKSSDLLYVSTSPVSGVSPVYVYTYPAAKLTQTLTQVSRPSGECVDKEGDVFITQQGSSGDAIVEYAHGGSSPKAILQDARNEPQGCAINPQNGDLAVTHINQSTGYPATVSIFKRAKGTPTIYTDNALLAFAYCGYDDKGNLLLDGTTSYFSGYLSYIAELPKGKTSFTNFPVYQWLDGAFDTGGVQWDGKNVAVGDAGKTIYRFSIRNSKVTKVGKTSLEGADHVYQFWIDGSNVIGGSTNSGRVDVWKYPAGGKPIKQIARLKNPMGVVISPGK